MSSDYYYFIVLRSYLIIIIIIIRAYHSPEVANQSETKSHVFYCVTAKSRITQMDTHEHHLYSSSLTHIPLLS